MKNVLFVIDNKCMSGESVLLNDILNMIDLSNLNVDVLVLHDYGDMLKDLPNKVSIIYGSKYFSSINMTFKDVLKTHNIINIFRKLVNIIDLKTGLIKYKIKKERRKLLSKDYDYEIAFKDGFTALFTAYGNSGVKYHWIQHDYVIDDLTKRYEKLYVNALNSFDKIIAVSEGIKKDFNKIYHLNDKVVVIDNLVNTKRIKIKAKSKTPIDLESNKFNIICVGNIINSHKGYDRLLSVVDRLNKDNLFEDVVLRIYGDGPDIDDNRKFISKNNLKGKVYMCGRVDNPYKYYSGNDLFIMPSYYEAFGLVLVEAMTLGVPTLATRNNATDKLINNDYNGLVVDNSDEGLYNGLRDLLLNREKISKYKACLVDYNYSNDDILNQINNLFKDNY